MHPFVCSSLVCIRESPQSRGGSRGAIAAHKIYESNFIHHDFLQLGKQHSRHKAILSFVVLSQQCCEVYFILLTIANYQIQGRP